jgi:hypothetical protein
MRFSRTLQSADWPQTRIARGDTAEEIARLKAEPGGEIVAHGGTQFVRSLIRLGLVDQYRLWVLPARDIDHLPAFRPGHRGAFQRLPAAAAPRRPVLPQPRVRSTQPGSIISSTGHPGHAPHCTTSSRHLHIDAHQAGNGQQQRLKKRGAAPTRQAGLGCQAMRSAAGRAWDDTGCAYFAHARGPGRACRC